MKKLMILGLLFSYCGLTIAQKAPVNKYEIKGIIIDNKNVPVPFANVLLYNSQDSTSADGTTTDEEGMFAIPARAGIYYLKISFLSYQTKTIPDIKVSNNGLLLDKIVL